MTVPAREEIQKALKVPEVKHNTDRLGRRRNYKGDQVERHKIDHAFNRSPRKGLKPKWMWI